MCLFKASYLCSITSYGVRGKQKKNIKNQSANNPLHFKGFYHADKNIDSILLTEANGFSKWILEISMRIITACNFF